MSFLAILIFSIVIVLAMTPDIQDWIGTPHASTGELPEDYVYIIFPVPILLFTINGTGFQVWHIIMLSIFIGAFTYGKYDLIREWLSRKNQFLLSLIAPEKANSSIEGVAKLFMASTFFSTLYFLFLALINTEMSTPPFDEFSRPELIYGLFNASVFEELVSRALLIGIPLLLYAIIKKWKNPLKALIGGGLDITPTTMSLITLSAVFFALAHVGGWDLWKVPQVLVTGFALGYAFVRYGLHASILVHFSINLSTSALEIWPDNIILGSLFGAVFLIWIIIGCYFFFDYIWRLLIKLNFIQQPEPSHAPPGYQGQPPPMTGYQPPPSGQQYYAGQPIRQAPPPQVNYASSSKGFICPNCGNTGANYSEGQLTCMRCQTIFGGKPVVKETDEKQIYDF